MKNETKPACFPNRFHVTVTKLVDLAEVLVIWRGQIVVRIEKPVWLLTNIDPTRREKSKLALVNTLSSFFSPLLTRVEAAQPRSRWANAGRIKEEPDCLTVALLKELFSTCKILVFPR